MLGLGLGLELSHYAPATDEIPEGAFAFVVDTSLGADTDLAITLQISNTEEALVTWGDGSEDSYTGNGFITKTHTYDSDGEYTVYVEHVIGTYSNPSLASDDRVKMTKILQWGDYPGGNFSGYTSLATLPLNDQPDFGGAATTTISSFFRNADALVSGVGHWDTSATTGFAINIFRDCALFNEDLSGWDTSNWTSMGLTFFAAPSFNQSLGSWDISSCTTMSQMIQGSGMSTANYDATLIGWAAQAPNIQSNVVFSLGPKYTSAAQSARDLLTGTYGWTISDGGLQT